MVKVTYFIQEQTFSVYSVRVLDQTCDCVCGGGCVLPALFLAPSVVLLFHVQIPVLRGLPHIRCQQNNHKLTVVRNDTGAAIDQLSRMIS